MNHTHLATKLITLLIPFCVACSDGGDDDGGGGTAGTSGSGGGGGGSTNPYSGKTYLLEFAERHWDQPRGAAQDFAPYMRGFILQVSGDSLSSYSAKIGTLQLNVGDTDPPPPPVQDLCSPTGTLTASDTKIGPGDFKMNIRHLSEDLNAHTTVRALTFDKIYPTPMNEREGTFAATLDARDIAHLFTQLVAMGDVPTKEQLCDTLEMDFSVPCAPCPHDSEPWCLTLTAVNFEAVETTIALQDVSEATAMSAACQGGLSN